MFVFFSSLFVVYYYCVLDVFNAFGLCFRFPSYVRYDLPLLYFLVLFLYFSCCVNEFYSMCAFSEGGTLVFFLSSCRLYLLSSNG